MEIESTRFGTIEVDEGAVLTFPDGLIGLPGSGYVLLATREDSPFLWLHSIDHAEIAVPVTTPWLFFATFEVRVSDEDARRLGLDAPEQAQILCVVRAAERLEDFTVNLVAPIVIHSGNRVGRQIINDTGGYAVRQPLFSEVELTSVQPTAPAVPVAARAV
jgi:flagellar assembly factor FliW